MNNRANIAVANIIALMLGLFVLVNPATPAQATTGDGLSMAIRSDSRSLAWVKSQGFDAWHGGECFSTSNAVLTQNWAMAEPAAGCGVDNFQVFATGYLKAPASGLFQFRVIVNDAFELRLNGKEVMRYWADSTTTGKTFTSTTAQSQTLEAGKAYPIAFWYRDFTKEAHFKVQWKYPGSGDYADIPVTALDDNLSQLLGGTQQEVVCPGGIGASAECPAYSPQELFAIQGTQTDGEYWLMVAGVPTKVHMYMDPKYAGDNGQGFVQLMHIPKGNGGGYTGLSSDGARFNYDSPLWTDQYLTLNNSAGPWSTAKRNTYNYTPVSKVMAIFYDAANFSWLGPIGGNWNTNFAVVTGDVTGFPSNEAQTSPLVWIENVPSFASNSPAIKTFDNQVTQTEAVVEPVNDASPGSGVTTTSRSVKRIKISVDNTRSNQLVGLLINRQSFNYDGKLRIQAPKTGVFARAKNPYNEWYGFNFRGKEWNPSLSSKIKMRWGFYSMGYQEQFAQRVFQSDFYGNLVLVDYSHIYTSSFGEQQVGPIYKPGTCNAGGCGYWMATNAGYGQLSRYLAIGGIGLNDSNAAAFQPHDLSRSEVILNDGSGGPRPRCSSAYSYLANTETQHLKEYGCAYQTGLYGQMPSTSFATMSPITVKEATGGFEVTWSAVVGATEYVIAHRKLGEPWKSLRVQNASTLSKFFPERGPGTYEFKVSARKVASAISYQTSAPASASAEVGVGLGGGDELLLASGIKTIALNDALSDSPLVVTGITGSSVIAGLTITVTSASASISTIAGLSTYSSLTPTLSRPIVLSPQSSSITIYGSLANINNALASLNYEHIDPLDPVGSIKIEAFDSGNNTYKFNPNNQHYYKVVTQSGSIGFRDAYCRVKVGNDHRTGGPGGYDDCKTPNSGEQYNGIAGYLATITSLSELNWLAQSGLLTSMKSATNIANAESGPNATYAYDDLWIGASDLRPETNGSGNSDVDGRFTWTNESPISERDGLAHSYFGSGNNTIQTNSAIAGIKTHQRNRDKYSFTLLKTNITNYPTFLFANASSLDSDTVHGYLVEYSDDAGKNPLYKSRTIRFALAPELGAETLRSVTSTSAALDFAIDPGNSAASVEVTYSAVTPIGLKTGFAVVNPALTESATTVTATLSGLLPYTTYSYTITVTNQGGVVTETGSFMTAAGLPEALALSATDVTHNSAVLGASVRSNASGLTSIQLAYGTSSILSGATTENINISGFSGIEAQEASKVITGLSPETTYYYRTTVVNSAGTSTSQILSFKTGKDLTSNPNQLSSASSEVLLPNGIEISANHPNIFTADFDKSPAQDALYISYTLKNTSAQTVDDLWLNLQDFTGGSVLPVSSQDSQKFVGSLSPNQSKTLYFYLKALGETEVDQSHLVKLTQGQPGTYAASTSSSIVFSFDAVRSVTPSNSLIRDVRFNTSAPPLGGEFKITSTGTLDSQSGTDEFFFTPAVFSNWPADSLRLENIRIVFPDISATPSCPSVVVDAQLIGNACYRGQAFEVSYTFRVIDFPANQLNIAPSVTSGDGSSWLGSDPSDNPPVTTTVRPQQNLSITPAVSDSATTSQVSIAGTTYSEVTVTVDVDNTSLRSSSLDQILVDLGAGTTFDLDSAYLLVNGQRVSLSASVVDSTSNVIAIDGPISAKAGDDVKVVFEVLVPVGGASPTTTNMEITGKIGDTEVGPLPGNTSTTTVEVNSTGAVSASTAVSAVSARAEGVAASDVFANTATIQSKLFDAAAGATLSFVLGQSAELANGTRLISGSPSVATGASFETFAANLTGLTPGTTYYYRAVVNGVPAGDVMSFTTLAEDKPFVGLSSQPLPTVAICTETELACPPTVITPPVVSCGDCSVSYTISAGALPPGMTLNPNTGEITGTPTGTGGTYPFTLTATATKDDASASPMVASQTYNLVTAPNTAEPSVQSATAGNLSNNSALISATLGYVPNGELVKLVVRYLDANSNVQTLTTEVIGEGNNQANQLVSFNVIGLTASTTYSFQVGFGAKSTEWIEFSTTANATVPVAPAVTDTKVNQVDNSTALISATVSNPIAGDALGFVVGQQQDLSDAKTYIATNADASSELGVTTQLTNLVPGNYFYRVLLGDGLSTLTYPFSIGVAQNNSSAGSSTGGTGSESSSSAVTKYKSVGKKLSFYFQPGATKLTTKQQRELVAAISSLPKDRFGLKVTALGWAAARPILSSDLRVSTLRARNVIAALPAGLEGKIRALGKSRARSSSDSSRRVDLWIAYKVPISQ